ncbi:MAG: acetate--CoA ligase, partial [Candidatus Poseidoniales archaeon]
MKIFNPNNTAKSNAHIGSIEEYKKKYKHSIDKPEEFWAKQAERISWFKKWDKTWEWNFNKAEVKWFEGAKLNASYNCIDRHVNGGYGDKPALIWEGNDSSENKTYTYNNLLEEVQLAANALKNLGIVKGDRVCIYMQMIPELAISVLACARIGAVHSVVFGAFAPDSLEARINDSKCKVLITQDTGVRGTKNDIPMKQNGDIATKKTPSIEKVLVVKRTGSPIEMDKEKDVWWHDAINSADKICVPEEMDAEDPLFILYTSGSTGKPKGVMHTTGGYMVYTATTHHYIFDYHPDEVYWCTADIGWITGHSYIIYGPMANRATTMMFEGVPNYPDYGRFWEIIEKHKVNKFYTAPTALRALMKEGDKWPNKYNLESLKILGTVGEPIKEPEWLWYHKIIGKERCPIVDTWWQTETGGIMIAPLPAVTPTKPGSATLPFFGIVPELLDNEGNVLEGNNVEGNLVMQRPWPGMMRTVYGDHQRFFET